MMKKIPENSPYANSFPPSIPISLNGGQNKSILGTLNNNFLTNIHSKTGKGNLIIHLLKF
jgi:hypothetical protein